MQLQIFDFLQSQIILMKSLVKLYGGIRILDRSGERLYLGDQQFGKNSMDCALLVLSSSGLFLLFLLFIYPE